MTDREFHALPFWFKLQIADDQGFEVMAGNFIRKSVPSAELRAFVESRSNSGVSGKALLDEIRAFQINNR